MRARARARARPLFRRSCELSSRAHRSAFAHPRPPVRPTARPLYLGLNQRIFSVSHRAPAPCLARPRLRARTQAALISAPGGRVLPGGRGRVTRRRPDTLREGTAPPAGPCARHARPRGGRPVVLSPPFGALLLQGAAHNARSSQPRGTPPPSALCRTISPDDAFATPARALALVPRILSALVRRRAKTTRRAGLRALGACE